jgi:hypothetical protein
VTTFYETIKVINSRIALEKARESILDGGTKVIESSRVRNNPRGDDR